MGQNTDAVRGDNKGEEKKDDNSPDETKPVSTTDGGGSGQGTGAGTGGNNNFVPEAEPKGTFDLDRPSEGGTSSQDTTKTVETVERNIRDRAESVKVDKTLDDSYKDNSLSDAEATRRQEEYKRKFYEQKSQEEEKYAKDNPEYPEDK